MAQNTLKDAVDLVMRNYNTPRFLTPDEIRAKIAAHADVMGLIRDSQKVYVSTYATLIGETPSGKVKAFRHLCGSEICLIDMQAIFVADNNWCNGKPIILALMYPEPVRATVYWQRKKYVRLYDGHRTPEEVEQLAERDWANDQSFFTVEG